MATLTKGKTFANGELVTPQKLHELVDLGMISGIVNADVSNSAAIALSKLATGALPTGITVASANIVDGTIVNADISASAAIADTKLATISTAGKVSNSATTATSANTANALVARDATGNFSAGTITAALSGNASSATTSAACSGNAATASKLATARTITLEGDLSGSVSFDGSANATLTAAVLDDSHNHVISNIDGLQTALDGKQAAGSYAPATGIAPSAITGTAVVTTDSRLSDARTPTSHPHGNITNAGAIGSTSGAPIITGTSGVLQAGSFGTTAGTFCQGNDSRLSDARTPVTHTHAISDTTGLQTALDGKAAASHTHTIANVTGLQTALDGKQASGSYAPATGIAQSAVTNLTTDLAGKAPASHTHTIANVTGLQTALDGKQASGSYAPATGIAQSAVTNLTTDLAGKAASSHTHDATDISGKFTNFKFGPSDEIAAAGFEQTNIERGTTVIIDAGRNSLPGAILARWQRTNNSGVTSIIGTITSAGSGTFTTGVAYNTSSDYRLKTNIEPLTAAVARLLQIPVHRFNWVADRDAPKVDGFLAHEAQAIVPESVTGHKDEVDAEGKPIHQGIDQSKLVPLLVAAVQELAARVAALEAR